MKLILQSTLRSLGITEKYAGFSLAVTAISLCFERPSRLRSVTKEVYWETAELHGCNRSDVERNIRTVIHHAWKVNRPGSRPCQNTLCSRRPLSLTFCKSWSPT